jgi:hypothetical protein
MGKRILVAGVIAGAALFPSAAFAQDTTTQVGGTAGGQVTTSTPPVVTSTAQATPPKVEVKPAETDTDHERYIGKFAVGYFGISQLPIALGAPGGAGVQPDTVAAPVVGVRYWINRMIGIDGGIGLGLSGGSVEVVNGGTSTTTDKKSKFGTALHVGVPLALAHGKHYSFLVIPEGNIGFTSGTIKGAAPPGGVAPPDQDLSGFLLDLGGRVGAEIHFGFIGVPQLSLEGSVGVSFRRSSFKWKQDNNSASDGTTTLGTTVQSDPWAIFVNNISAFYYFE